MSYLIKAIGAALAMILIFSTYSFGREVVLENTNPDKDIYERLEFDFSEDEFNLLVQLVHGEAGCSWLEDKHQVLVVIVVLNRINKDSFPDSLEGVVYQPSQYACVDGPQWDVEPDSRTRRNVRRAIRSYADFPHDVYFQSEFIQGEVYAVFYDEILESTTYFCR